MAIDTAKFINYAAAKIPNGQIAAAFGITPARVTQLLDDSRVQELVAKRKQELAAEEIEDQTGLRTARSRLLKRVNDLVEHTDSLGEATRALETLTRLRDPDSERTHNRSGDLNLITIELPSFLSAKLSVELNGHNEIMEIEGRNMATMPTLATHKMIKERKTNDQGTDPVKPGGLQES